MKAARKSFIIVCLDHPDGFTEKNYPCFRQLVESFNPDYWEFLNPGTSFVCLFDTATNTVTADSLVKVT